ncbi:MAG TPA: HEAT repeat domain-containing protein [Sedimentisphaerales bacterium]|nr:HEAT repeat domain-containing protein [Sedimentisphaerales bacterium]
MNRRLNIALFIIMLSFNTPVVAAESEMMAQLDQTLKDVAKFEYGKDSGPLVRVEQIVVESATDTKLRDAVEQRIIRTLGSVSTNDAKSFLCRQLRTIGTARCVPQLEKLLTDPELSHMARYALGRIDAPEVGVALHRALKKTSGKIKAGIINTLVEVNYGRALGDFMGLIGNSNKDVAIAAIKATGHFPCNSSVSALRKARRWADKDIQFEISAALLTSAEVFLANGDKQRSAAIYEDFYSGNYPGHLRVAGLRGLAISQGAQAAPLLIEAIKGDDSDLRRSAIEFMTMVKGKEATGAFVALLPSLQPEAQVLVLGALGTRGDSAAASAVTAATRSEHESVRLAALEALGSVGNATSVLLLARTAATAGDSEKKVARASLERLSDDDVKAVLVLSINSGDAELRAEIIRTIAARGVTQTAGELLKAARDDNDMVRREAIRALGVLVDVSELDVLVELAMKPKDAKDLPAFEQAIAAVFRRVRSKDLQAAPVLAALASAPTNAKPMLVRLLGKPATPKALEAVRAALKDVSAEVKDAAVRTLSDWPNAGPAQELLTLVRTSTNRTHKVLALRGYVRMAGMSQDPTAMYIRAMELAERPDDKKLVLGGLGSANSAQALTLVEGYLKDKQLQTEAAQAAIQIADRLRQNEPTRAKTALKNVVAVVKDSRIRRKAQDVINEMEQHEGYILVWLAAGPYIEKGKESRAIFDMAFPPEKPEAGDVKWKRLTQGVGSWDINLEATFGSRDHCGAYMRTQIWAPENQDARLELGSDDSIKVWLNGKLVHSNYANRGMSPRQDLVDVKLRNGWNELMLKVVDNEGGWAFCCRVRRPDGTALEGLKVEAK